MAPRGDDYRPRLSFFVLLPQEDIGHTDNDEHRQRNGQHSDHLLNQSDYLNTGTPCLRSSG